MEISLPQQFTDRMREMLGSDHEAFIDCYEKPPVKSFRLNRRKVLPVDYARMGRILAENNAPEEVSFWQGAYYYDDARPGSSPYHEAGICYVQEASAMYPVTLLDVDDSGMKVLDLCAAPGGKSSQIAELMNGSGLLVSNEIIPSRASILSENMERMGVENALVISSDPKDLIGRFPVFFDRILVDAPCSGEGMFRRNPEAISEWSPQNVTMCAGRQDMILDCAAAMLAPGGRIVYSTCTFSNEEDEGSIERFLSRHSDFSICDGPHRLFPHTFKGEGHFACALEHKGAGNRNGVTVPRYASVSQNRPPFSLSNALLSSFLDETIAKNGRFYDKLTTGSDRLLGFGDSIYLAPEHMPDIKGLKVLRAGIKLGTFKKNRFEPDHALSHVLGCDDVCSYVNLYGDSNEVRQYLSGMTLNCDRDMKGWCLVCVDGFPLGWGKAAGKVVKNHYPRGLRK